MTTEQVCKVGLTNNNARQRKVAEKTAFTNARRRLLTTLCEERPRKEAILSELEKLNSKAQSALTTISHMSAQYGSSKSLVDLSKVRKLNNEMEQLEEQYSAVVDQASDVPTAFCSIRPSHAVSGKNGPGSVVRARAIKETHQLLESSQGLSLRSVKEVGAEMTDNKFCSPAERYVNNEIVSLHIQALLHVSSQP